MVLRLQLSLKALSTVVACTGHPLQIKLSSLFQVKDSLSFRLLQRFCYVYSVTLQFYTLSVLIRFSPGRVPVEVWWLRKKVDPISPRYLILLNPYLPDLWSHSSPFLPKPRTKRLMLDMSIRGIDISSPIIMTEMVFIFPIFPTYLIRTTPWPYVICELCLFRCKENENKRTGEGGEWVWVCV